MQQDNITTDTNNNINPSTSTNNKENQSIESHDKDIESSTSPSDVNQVDTPQDHPATSNTETNTSSSTIIETTTPQQTKKDILRWKPLECVPEVLQDMVFDYGMTDCVVNEFLGVDYAFMFPAESVECFIIMYPITHGIEDMLYTEYPSTQDITQDIIDLINEDEIIHIKQRIANACGTFAFLHYAMNKRTSQQFLPDSPFETIRQVLSHKTNGLGNAIELENLAFLLEETHERSAMTALAQTNAVDYENTNVHYITIVRSDKSGRVWLLDGRRDAPVLITRDTTKKHKVLSYGQTVLEKIHEAHARCDEYSETGIAALAISRLE